MELPVDDSGSEGLTTVATGTCLQIRGGGRFECGSGSGQDRNREGAAASSIIPHHSPFDYRRNRNLITYQSALNPSRQSIFFPSL
jgi:hypothetical protein